MCGWALDVLLNPRKGERDGGREGEEGEREGEEEEAATIYKRRIIPEGIKCFIFVYFFKLLGMRAPRILLKWADETRPF